MIKYLFLTFLITSFSTCLINIPSVEEIEVNEKIFGCMGIVPMTCMKIRWKGSESWEYMYQNIEGFNYSPGFRYRILVQISSIENPPADGSSLHYKLVGVISKTLVPEISKIEELEIKESLIDCMGIAPMKCMVVRSKGAQSWNLMYQGIDGFVYQPGYHYRLEVLVTQVLNPPADGSSLNYELLNIFEKKPVSAVIRSLEKFEIYERKTGCVGVAQNKCLMVKKNNDKKWTPFYQKIEGFEPKGGFRYYIEVKTKEIKNSPENDPSKNYKLFRILKKQKF